MKAEQKELENSVQGLKASLDSIKAALPQAPVFAFIEKFDTFVQKKKRILAKEEALFEPGENPYLYIVTSGALAVFRITPSGEQKEVGKAYAGSFL